jgi:hypothetical protein
MLKNGYDLKNARVVEEISRHPSCHMSCFVSEKPVLVTYIEQRVPDVFSNTLQR